MARTFKGLGRRWVGTLVGAFVTAAIAGCIGGKPSAFPGEPMGRRLRSDGATAYDFDVNGDWRADYSEVCGPAGKVVELVFSEGADARAVAFPQPRGTGEAHLDLVIILDSIPAEMVAQAYDAGRFRLFHPPSRVISPFPVMTDLCLNDLFGTAPSPGVETHFYDGAQTSDGWGLYEVAGNSPWLSKVDWHYSYGTHQQIYLSPRKGFRAELARIEEALADRHDGRMIAYCVSTSALGFIQGRAGHVWGLDRLEQFCRMLVHRFEGRIDITLMSDHGQNLTASQRLPLRQILDRLGYHRTTHLADDDDVVELDLGLVTYAALHTREPRRLADRIVHAVGVELAMYRGANDCVVVVGERGLARIKPCDGGWRYVAESGDPLRLKPVIAALDAAGALDANGCIDDAAMFTATVNHRYPDPLERCWRALHDEVEYTPDVLLSLSEGWHWGSPFLDQNVEVAATHGNLNRRASTGFVMSTAGRLPEALRMRNVAAALADMGISWPLAEPTATGATD